MVVGRIILPDSYNFNLACGNCSRTMLLKIPRGITVEKYAKDHSCPNCGCKLGIPTDQTFHPSPVVPAIYLPYGLRREM